MIQFLLIIESLIAQEATKALPVTNNVTISFPNWFCAFLSIGILAVVFYLGALHFRIGKICDEFPKVKQALTRISEILLQKKLAKDFIFSASPVKLTEDGIKILQEAKFEDFYNINKKELLDRVKKKQPKTMADLEKACKEIMLSIEDTLPAFEPIQQCVYNNGIPVMPILMAGAIFFRDKASNELSITA
jgi:hypothetical protein